MGNLITLDFLDLSHNNLSGQIPKSLEALSHIQYRNFSWSFMNVTSRSFMENEALCGNPILKVPPCASNSFEKNHGNNVQSQNLIDLYSTTEHRMISYLELLQATDDFCEANLLGVGGYGSIYKGSFRSFDIQCKVLRITRHRNLIGVIKTCSNPKLRALVLQYMSNGSLEMLLYSHNSYLNLLQRIGIMIDVALALEYLHYGQLEHVVHCDLKSSNVFLDDDMVAHTRTLGTIGYIAPVRRRNIVDGFC
ncbi:hypothetical protein CsSME_00008227 [Camellia sinensis var. sinensis]